MKTLIVTGGTLDYSFLRQYEAEQCFDYTIASDSGIHYFIQAGAAPDELAGDFDSADKEDLKQLHAFKKTKIHTYPVKKDATDTELALRLALERGSSEIHIAGFSGTRFDHMLGTLHTMGIALEKQTPCYLVDAYNRVRLLSGPLTIQKEEQYGDYVSFLPLTTEVTDVTLKGFQYPLSHATLSGYGSLGISNVITEEEAHITFGKGILIMVEARDASAG